MWTWAHACETMVWHSCVSDFQKCVLYIVALSLTLVFLYTARDKSLYPGVCVYACVSLCSLTLALLLHYGTAVSSPQIVSTLWNSTFCLLCTAVCMWYIIMSQCVSVKRYCAAPSFFLCFVRGETQTYSKPKKLSRTVARFLYVMSLCVCVCVINHYVLVCVCVC